MAKSADKSKFVFVVLDGAADRPIKEFGGKTPFDVAYTPNLDYFAKNGRTGVMNVVKKGVAPESDSAIMALLGYDPFVYFTGRGPLEAYGSGTHFKRGDLVLRANFATVKNKKIIDRRVSRTLTTKEAHVLAEALNKKVEGLVKFIQTKLLWVSKLTSKSTLDISFAFICIF